MNKGRQQHGHRHHANNQCDFEENTMINKTISWFEIPASDLNRAAAFYEQILSLTFNRVNMGADALAVFPYDREHATGGTLIAGPVFTPASQGSIVYLSANPSLDAVLARIEPAGGSISLPRTELGPGMGAYARIVDTEGTLVGLHADA
jgi:predicted enzyme related to lactoylglutathione lyase